MKRPLNRILLLLALAWGTMALASLPEPPDPREVAKLSPQQRFEQARSLHQALEQASPQERREFRDKARQKMQALSPQEQREVHDRMHADW